MNDHELAQRLAFAKIITCQAGKAAKEYFDNRADLTIEFKGKQDFVSHADRAVETIIRDGLAQSWPDDGVFGEEHGGTQADPCWIIDPIDGTANFLRGLPYWCVTIAFVMGGQTVLGVTYDPVHDELYWAQKGAGAWRNNQRIDVSARATLANGCVGLAFTFKQQPESYIACVTKLLAAGIDHRRLGSSALLLAHTADGRFDGMIANYVNSWDVLAGLLLVEEAGGLATNFLAAQSLNEPQGVLAGTHAAWPELKKLVLPVN